MSLVPSLLQAIVQLDGEALVMHVGDKPYVVSPTGQVDLATRGLSLDAVVGVVNELLPIESQQALDEFGAAQYELPALAEFPGERFTIVAARGGDDVWAEVRRRRMSEDDRVPMELFGEAAPEQAGGQSSMSAEPVARACGRDVGAGRPGWSRRRRSRGPRRQSVVPHVPSGPQPFVDIEKDVKDAGKDAEDLPLTPVAAPGWGSEPAVAEASGASWLDVDGIDDVHVDDVPPPSPPAQVSPVASAWQAPPSPVTEVAPVVSTWQAPPPPAEVTPAASVWQARTGSHPANMSNMPPAEATPCGRRGRLRRSQKSRRRLRRGRSRHRHKSLRPRRRRPPPRSPTPAALDADPTFVNAPAAARVASRHGVATAARCDHQKPSAAALPAPSPVPPRRSQRLRRQ